MGKSSSSVKKKRSSLARTRKRSKSRFKKSNKSKRLRRRDDSISYSSASDDSRSSVSVSCSSSENGYKSKRSRSRMRKDVKGRRKRAQRQSSSCESDEGFRFVKKRKGLKKTDDLQVRKRSDKRKKKKKKKKKEKKKAKRKASVSSASSGSLSCSTSQGGSGSSSESEVEKNGSRFDRKGKDRRRMEKVRSGSKRRRSRSKSWSSYSQRRRSRSRSWSSYSHYNESSGYRSEENLISEVNPRRLKSVITVVREGREDGGMDEDKHIEEMVYDYDDFPRRSIDSNDGVSKRDLVHNSHVASEKKRYAEDEEREEDPFNYNTRTGNVSESDKEDGGGQYGRSNSGIGMGNAVNETANEDSGGVDSSSSYDLETILRKKALENLRTFRKGTQLDAKAPVNQKDTNECEVKTLITTKAEFNQHKSPKGGDPRAIGGSPVAEKSITPAVSEGSIDFAHKKISDINDVIKGSQFTKDDAVHPPDQVALASNPNENVSATVRLVPRKSRLISLSSRQESSDICTDKKHVSELQEPPQAKSLTANSMVETARTAIPLSSNSNSEEANNASASDDPSTCPKSRSGVDNSNKQEDEATEDSQFQQKTMSVMRGGEMVEVSYKVYIPKKAPALARRPLRR